MYVFMWECGMRLFDGINEKINRQPWKCYETDTKWNNGFSEIWNKSAHSKNYYRYDLCYNEMKEKKQREKKERKLQIMYGDTLNPWSTHAHTGTQWHTKHCGRWLNAYRCAVWLVSVCVNYIPFSIQTTDIHSSKCSYHCVNFSATLLSNSMQWCNNYWRKNNTWKNSLKKKNRN